MKLRVEFLKEIYSTFNGTDPVEGVFNSATNLLSGLNSYTTGKIKQRDLLNHIIRMFIDLAILCIHFGYSKITVERLIIEKMKNFINLRKRIKDIKNNIEYKDLDQKTAEFIDKNIWKMM